MIGIDWGTTSARAYRLDAAGTVLAERQAPLGIQQVRDGAFAAAFGALQGDWAQDPAPRLACGMIGSRQGWQEAPYVECPAPLDALAAKLVRTAGDALAIVPGVCDRDGQGVPDVMRGEETQILGALPDDAPATLVVLPGTHSKWAIAGGGRIDAFASYMTGEIFAVLKEHSILGRMIPAHAQASIDEAAFARGVRCASASDAPRGALLHQLFGARTLALFDRLAGGEIADYLSGLLIGSEIAAGREWAARHAVEPDAVILVGAPELCARYAAALREAGADATTGRPDAAARGLWRIARRAGMLR